MSRSSSRNCLRASRRYFFRMPARKCARAGTRTSYFAWDEIGHLICRIDEFAHGNCWWLARSSHSKENREHHEDAAGCKEDASGGAIQREVEEPDDKGRTKR